MFALFFAATPVQAASTDLSKIQHIIIIMQENRSFDHYFGTYPGADGIANIPPGTCILNPVTNHCVVPFLTTEDKNGGSAHNAAAFNKDYDKGKMDGFLRQRCGGATSGSDKKCKTDTADVMGYHDRTTLGNYWAYADNFVLQDRMFEAVSSWSLPSHLFMVSAWSAICTNQSNPMTCKDERQNVTTSTTKPWTDITYLLYKSGVSWGYFLDDGLTPSCASDDVEDKPCAVQNNKISSYWNPLPKFLTIQETSQQANIKPLANFYQSLQDGTLPSVNWIVPNSVDSEHPNALVSVGQAYVTSIVNAVSNSPFWQNSVIFISWDDWGGFYDHVPPPQVDKLGYGFRVPALMISPYAKKGFIDHQTLSHDAYLKFIEDVFLGSRRIDPKTDGRPDSRTSVRENNPALGDLAQEFDFTQAPRAPLLLP